MNTIQHFTRGAAASSITIACNSVACLQDARGLKLQVESGCVWITESGSIGDVVLDAGESFTITRDGITVVSACRPQPYARVHIQGSHGTAPAWGERMRDWAQALFAPWARPAMSSR
jgi:hypothetical protein